MSMLYLVYDILLILAVPLLVPFYLIRSLRRGRLKKGMGERLGFFSRKKTAFLAGRDTIWVHAVSVGETMAARPLLKALKSRYPDHLIVLSTVTETGQGIGEGIRDVDLCIYFPLDFSLFVKRTLKIVHPSLIVVVETEIWPNFLRQARLMGVPALLANGRISDKSFAGYGRFSAIFRSVLPDFSALCMQTEEDARRIVAIGAPAGRVYVAKNLKYDLDVVTPPEERKAELRARYRIPGHCLILTAGSTHQGEEESVLSAYQSLIQQGVQLILILAPRHPERSEEVAALLERHGIYHVRRSSLAEAPRGLQPGEALLMDCVGELMDVYAISGLVFVGGSLVPVGGHNLLEPASLGVPVLFGPHMNNFREIAAKVLEAGAGVQVADAGMLASSLQGLLDDQPGRVSMGANGARLVTENGGATSRHMEVIASFLPHTDGREDAKQ